MKAKQIIFEDFINYKKPSMLIATPVCSFKCDKECGRSICQNSELAAAPSIEIDDYEIIKEFNGNPITEAIIFTGFEPFDSFEETLGFIQKFRQTNSNDVVIYTGYYPNEISEKLKELQKHKNIIIKFGRFIPDKPHKFDEVLGVELSSDNQYALELDKLAIVCLKRKIEKNPINKVNIFIN